MEEDIRNKLERANKTHSTTPESPISPTTLSIKQGTSEHFIINISSTSKPTILQISSRPILPKKQLQTSQGIQIIASNTELQE